MFQSSLHNFLSLPIIFSRTGWVPVYTLGIFLIHVLFFNGILDIYFTSPVIKGITEVYRPSTPPPASRVFLIVVDGFNADVLFRDHFDQTPFLRRMAKEKGVWGYSIARTPTLSRPGHLALMSGVYEYMHGLSRPPYENDFDSVVNRSQATYLFGEWEIVDLFADAAKHKVHRFSYAPDFNDFSMPDPALLDQWVFQRVIGTVNKSSTSQSIKNQPAFFLLHLLGVDTFSHSHAVKGDGLATVIRGVDKGIETLAVAVEKAFGNDGRTVFILTADHGMSYWSAHGAGNTLDETRTPYIAWGGGIRKERRRSKNIAQVDVCAMIAALLGLDFPVQSVGKLPFHLLNVPWSHKAAMMRANAQQILRQFLIIRQQVKSKSLSLFFHEFPDLNLKSIHSLMKSLDLSVDHKESIKEYSELIDLATKGIYFYHYYYRGFRKTCLIAIFILILFACFLSCVRSGSTIESTVPVYEIVFFSSTLLLFVVFLIIDGRSVREWVYVFLLIYLLWGVYRQLGLLKGVSHLAFRSVLYVAVSLELLVFSLSLSRQLAALVLLLHLIYDFRVSDGSLHSSLSARIFIIGCVLQSIFPLLPHVGWSICYPLVYAGPALIIILTITLLRRRSWECCSKDVMIVVTLQILMIICSCWNHYRTHSTVKAGFGLPWGATVITKCLLVSSAVSVVFVGRRASTDVLLLSISLSATASFTLFSLFSETLYLFSLFLTLGAWVSLHRGYKVPYYLQLWTESGSGILLNDSCVKSSCEMNGKWLYYATGFVMYMCVTCFGIGNIVTISSYDPHMVLCYQGVFDLNIMTLVVFLKDAIPLILVLSHFIALLHNVNRVQIIRMFVLTCGIVTLHLTFMIRDKLPWLTFASQVNHFTGTLLYMAFIFVTYPIVSLIMPEPNFQIV